MPPTNLLRAPLLGRSGSALLALATRTALTVARLRQYEAFLDNPDPVGDNQTTYAYRSAARPTPAVAVATRPRRSTTTRAVTIAAGLLLAAALAACA